MKSDGYRNLNKNLYSYDLDGIFIDPFHNSKGLTIKTNINPPDSDVYRYSKYIYNDMKATRDFFERQCLLQCQNFYITPKKIIFNPPATIVIWEDRTKTVVKKQPGDIWDPEKGIVLCFMKKFCGNSGRFNNIFKKYIKDTDYDLQQEEITCTDEEVDRQK